MLPVARGRPRRALRRLCGIALLLTLIAGLSFLPFAGRFLVREDPIEPADAIVVLSGGRVERWLEAVDLFRERYAPLIVISPGRIERAEAELRAKGVRFPLEAELARDAMVQLGLPATAIQILPGNLDNTAHEAEAFHQFFRSAPGGASMQRIIVVTSPYHTRRAHFAFRREFRDSPVRILVRASRYDEAEPDRWWRHRADIRFVTSELQKLVLYGFGLGS